MKFELDTDKIIDNIVSEALKIDGKTIKQWMTEIAKHQWISVNDRLPKEDVFECLVVDHGETGFAYHQIRDGKHDFYMDYGDEIDGFDAVTHWMPLPEPPKEVMLDGDQ